MKRQQWKVKDSGNVIHQREDWFEGQDMNVWGFQLEFKRMSSKHSGAEVWIWLTHDMILIKGDWFKTAQKTKEMWEWYIYMHVLYEQNIHYRSKLWGRYDFFKKIIIILYFKFVHPSFIYLIQNTVKTVILWNIFYKKKKISLLIYFEM